MLVLCNCNNIILYTINTFTNELPKDYVMYSGICVQTVVIYVFLRTNVIFTFRYLYVPNNIILKSYITVMDLYFIFRIILVEK